MDPRRTSNRIHFRLWVGIGLALAIAATGCADAGVDSPDAQGPGLALGIDVLDAGSTRVEWSLTNNTTAPVRVLGWRTGLDPMPDPLFEVSRDGAAIRYEGPILHRVEPNPSHYVSVAPGERLAAEIDLGRFYDLRSGGTYDVQLRPLPEHFVLESESVALDSSASVRLRVEPADETTGTLGVAAGGGAFLRTGCTTEQYTELAAIEDEAYANTLEATEYFDAYGYDERALRWFGTGNTEDAYYVRMGLAEILGYLERGNIEYVCNAGGWCANGTTAAWVDPIFSPGVINLCEGFWVPDQPPWYTKVIAITHELAHFHTQWLDLGYRENALSLAKTAPASARSNAENYALYTVDSEIPCIAGIEDCDTD